MYLYIAQIAMKPRQPHTQGPSLPPSVRRSVGAGSVAVAAAASDGWPRAFARLPPPPPLQWLIRGRGREGAPDRRTKPNPRYRRRRRRFPTLQSSVGGEGAKR